MCRAYQLGANSFLVKPVDFEQFRNTIKTLGMYWMVVNQPPVNHETREITRQGHER